MLVHVELKQDINLMLEDAAFLVCAVLQMIWKLCRQYQKRGKGVGVGDEWAWICKRVSLIECQHTVCTLYIMLKLGKRQNPLFFVPYFCLFQMVYTWKSTVNCTVQYSIRIGLINPATDYLFSTYRVKEDATLLSYYVLPEYLEVHFHRTKNYKNPWIIALHTGPD